MTVHTKLKLAAALFRRLGELFQLWPLLFLAVYFLSPVGPHLRWEFQGRFVTGEQTYLGCTYLGARGLKRISTTADCPVLLLLDTRREY